MDEVLRNLIVGNEAALGAVGVFAEAGDEDRFELIAGEGLALVVADGVDHTVADVNCGAILGMIGLRAGGDGNASVALAVGAHGRWLGSALSGVSCLAEFLGDEADWQFLVGTDFARFGVDLGGIFGAGLL